MGSNKPRGLQAARKLRTTRRENRWADKNYKKRALGKFYKTSPTGGSSHAKGIVLEKVSASGGSWRGPEAETDEEGEGGDGEAEKGAAGRRRTRCEDGFRGWTGDGPVLSVVTRPGVGRNKRALPDVECPGKERTMGSDYHHFVVSVSVSEPVSPNPC
jgi:hypothetical protein